jgi:hypothetical protein
VHGRLTRVTCPVDNAARCPQGPATATMTHFAEDSGHNCPFLSLKGYSPAEMRSWGQRLGHDTVTLGIPHQELSPQAAWPVGLGRAGIAESGAMP